QVDWVQTPNGDEYMIYDAFGRMVRSTRWDQDLDRIYAGWTPLIEFSDCAQRNWWQGQGLDQAPVYTLLWDATCTPGSMGGTQFAEALALMELSQVGYTLAGAALTTYPGAAYGVIQDLHNDVVGLVDLQGKLREFYHYDVYGSRTQRTNAKGTTQCVSDLTEPCPSENGNPLGYTGRPLSPLTGLYDLRFRQYDPHLRMFLSADPLGYAASGFDLWLYVGGDPLNYIDPFGLEKTDPNEGKERFTPHAAAPLDTKRVPVEDRATKPGSKGDL